MRTEERTEGTKVIGAFRDYKKAPQVIERKRIKKNEVKEEIKNKEMKKKQ
jgi:hypothetical protein